MLNNPPINELEEKAGCRYLLVSAVAKRARKIMVEKRDRENKIGVADNVALDNAVDEFYNGDYRIVSTESADE